QAGFFMDDLLATLPLQLCTEICAAPILPDDRVVDRLAALPVPKDGGFALVGDADRRQLLQRDARLAQRFARHVALRLEDLLRVMLDPAGLRIDLPQFALRGADRGAFLVEQDGARAGRALIERENVTHGKF